MTLMIWGYPHDSENLHIKTSMPQVPEQYVRGSHGYRQTETLGHPPLQVQLTWMCLEMGFPNLATSMGPIWNNESTHEISVFYFPQSQTFPEKGYPQSSICSPYFHGIFH